MGIEIIAGLIAAAGVTGSVAVGGTSIAFATIGAYALVGGAVVGGSLLLQGLQEREHTSEQQTVKQALPPRQRIYGRALVGGSYYFFAANGGTLVAGLVLCEGPIGGVVEHWLNDEVSPNKSDSYGHADIWPWYQQVDFLVQNGTADQTGNVLISQQFPSWWTSEKRLRGLANVVVRCFLPADPKKNFAKFFPSGAPTYRGLVNGSLCYDPRVAAMSWTNEASWAWSDNPALCILDFLTYRRAMAIGTSHIDVASFVAMANLCDQQVAKADGATVKRYRLWGGYTLDEEPKNVLARMLKTCDGELYMTAAGKVALRGGAWTVPTVVIGADIVLGLEVQRGRDKLAKYNQLKIRYTDPNKQYQQVEGDPWDDVAAQTASGEVLPEDFDAVMVPNYNQAQRLAKIQMAKDNPDWIATVTTGIAGLNALGERTVIFDFPDLGINKQTFFVNAFEFGDDGATCKIGIGSLAASAYAWSTAEEKNTGAASQAPPGGPYVPPAPIGLQTSVVPVQITSTSAVPTLKVTVTPPTDLTLSLVAQYRLTGSSDIWRDMSADSTAYTAQSGAVSANASYDVRVALSTFGGSLSAYVTATIAIGQTSLGPIAQAMASGIALDMGLITEAVTITDDFGSITEDPIITIDLGGLT